MAGRSVLVSFITKFSNKGLKNATKDLSGMEKLTKRFSLGTKAAFAAAATAATVFAERLVRKSIKAIVEEQKQVATLTKTFENLGKGIELPQVLKFADDLQRASGISESVLRPALGALTQTLGETTAAQELLKKAIDISAGSGASLESVVSALQKAFNGNLTPLGKLIPSLDRAAIKSGDLSAVMEQLTTLFGGQGAVAAGTMQGAIDRLKVSADEAAERLGKGIGDALKILGTDGVSQVSNMGKALETAADRTSILLAGLASVGKELSTKLKSSYNNLNKQTDGLIGRVVKWGYETSLVGRAYNYLTKAGNEALATEAESARQAAIKTASVFTYSQELIDQANIIKGNLLLEEAARKAAEKAAALEKKRLAEEKKRKAEKAKQDRDDKTRAALAAKFDLDLINLEAAKKNAKTKEEMTRIEALMALKTESVKDDEAALAKLTALDEARNKALVTQAQEIIKLAAEDAKRALAAGTAIEELSKKKIEIPVTYVTKSGVEIPNAPGVGAQVATQKKSTAPTIILNQPEPPPSPMTTMPPPSPQRFDTAMVAAGNYSAALGAYFGGVGGQPVVNVNVQGSVVSEMDLRTTIETLFFQSQRAGTQTSLPNLGR
jgi:hypothetical protein